MMVQISFDLTLLTWMSSFTPSFFTGEDDLESMSAWVLEEENEF
jgi:hypothetical protein